MLNLVSRDTDEPPNGAAPGHGVDFAGGTVVAELIKYLSDEERDYLRQVFARSAARDRGAGAEHMLQLESSSIEREMLLRLLGRMHSELVASDGHYCLRFRIEIAPNPYGGPAVLRLLAPTVTDRQGRERPARVRPARDEIGLTGPEGREARVLDISNSGVAVEATGLAGAAPGTRLADLQLRLPGSQPFTVTGRVVRLQPGRAALEFEEIDPQAQSALRYYVLDHYDIDI